MIKIYIEGDSFAPQVFRKTWNRFFYISLDAEDADLVFVSQDTSIEENGKREQESIKSLVYEVYSRISAPLILTSQVEPGFTRSLGIPIYCMAETLRIKDADKRALKPDYFALGCPDPHKSLPVPIQQFVMPFDVEVIRCSYEEAEFSKIAVNMTLASQVENTNRLSQAAKTLGCDWSRISYILGKDKRIGSESYLKPGRWQDSQHLLRDSYTLLNIENG